VQDVEAEQQRDAETGLAHRALARAMSRALLKLITALTRPARRTASSKSVSFETRLSCPTFSSSVMRAADPQPGPRSRQG
jgi:hypothetical protein